MCIEELTPHDGRYARDILAMQGNLNFRSMLDLITLESSYRARRADGLVTLGLRTDQLTERHLLGLLGFRFAQYLQLGWVCKEVIATRGMFSEPTQGLRADDLHLVTLSGTGEILGYLGIVGSGDVEPLDMRDPGRRRFPVEEAHDIDLSDLVTAGRPVATDQVKEMKRFVHRRSMTDRGLRLQVTLELVLAAGSMVIADPNTRFMVGDVEEHVALRHLMMAGLQIKLLEGTSPRLSGHHYLHPAYDKRAVVRPFVAAVPPHEQTALSLRRLRDVLASENPAGGTRDLVAQSIGSVKRVAA